VPATVQLNDIIDALEMQFDESVSYLDLDGGQVVTVSDELLRGAEEHGDEEPDLPDWQKDELEMAKRIVSTDRFYRFRQSLMYTSGGSWRNFHSQWSPILFAASFHGRFTAQAHSEISRPPFGGSG